MAKFDSWGRATGLRHVREMNAHSKDAADVEGASMVRTESFSGVFVNPTGSPVNGVDAGAASPVKKRLLTWQSVLTGLVALVLLALALATYQSVLRIEQYTYQKQAELRETHTTLAALLREHGTTHGKVVDNLDALKNEQVNVAARIPAAITSDILPTLDRIETALTAAKPSIEFNSVDRAHLNRLLVSLHKVSERLNHVEQEVSQVARDSANPVIHARDLKDKDKKSFVYPVKSPLFDMLNNAQKPVSPI